MLAGTPTSRGVLDQLQYVPQAALAPFLPLVRCRPPAARPWVVRGAGLGQTWCGLPVSREISGATKTYRS